MYETILVATDGSPDAGAAAIHALELADRYEATVHALTVVETRTANDDAIVDPETVRRNLRGRAEAAVADVEREATARGTPVERSIVEGEPGPELAAAAEREDVDLVVLGARGRSAFKTLLLGSVAEYALAKLDVPVVIVSDGESDA